MTERIGAIVLAGGRSSRFGRDKLAEPIDGRPLLQHAIDAVRALTDDIVVVTAPDADPSVPEGVVLIRDERPFEGPLAGLSAGLAAFDPGVGRVIVVAGDMPSLVPALLSRLISALGPVTDLVMLEADGAVVPLPMGVRPAAALVATRKLLADGERRLRALPDALQAAVLAEAAWRLDDPDAATLDDIDTQADLTDRAQEYGGRDGSHPDPR